jgi:hypothetical protein
LPKIALRCACKSQDCKAIVLLLKLCRSIFRRSRSLKNSRTSLASRLFSPRTSLTALGVKLHSLKLFEVIAGHVEIKQKAIRHTPIEKLQDAFIAIVSGAHGLSEINMRVGPDQALSSGPWVAPLAPSSQWCRKRSRPVRQSRSQRWRQPWPNSFACTRRLIGMMMQRSDRRWKSAS